MAYGIKIRFPTSISSIIALKGINSSYATDWIDSITVYVTDNGNYIPKKSGGFVTISPRQLSWSMTKSGDTATVTGTANRVSVSWTPVGGTSSDLISTTVSGTDSADIPIVKPTATITITGISFTATLGTPDKTEITRSMTVKIVDSDGNDITEIFYPGYVFDGLYSDSTGTTLASGILDSGSSGYAVGHFTPAYASYIEAPTTVPVNYTINPKSLTLVPIAYTLKLSRSSIGKSALDYITIPEGYSTISSETYTLSSLDGITFGQYIYKVNYNPDSRLYRTAQTTMTVNIDKQFTDALDKQFGSNKVNMKYYNGTEWKNVSISIY